MPITRGAHAVAGVSLLALAVVAGPGCAGGAGVAADSAGLIPLAIEPTRTLASSSSLLRLGEAAYRKQCLACHGERGDGEGEAAYLLYPRPRDFASGQFRLVSTWDGVPTDADLYRSISRGMPGSAMPSWAHLSEETRWGLVHYVKSFSKRPLQVATDREPDADGNDGAGLVKLPPEPPASEASAARARELFATGCAPCHGATGRGDGAQQQIDSAGYPTRPRDLTLGVFKGSPEPEHVYRRIVAGLPGSPMPQSAYLHGDDAWALTRFVRSLSSDAQRAKVEMKKFRVRAERVSELPSHPDSGIWRQAEAVDLHLMPLWWRAERPEQVTVKALHDGRQLALLLSWTDPSHDATAMRPQDFRDAAAVVFAQDASDPPFFAMGERGGSCDIWMWKSERQADLEPAFQDLEKVYPNIGIDSYPNLLRSPLEQPMRHALTLESDPTFVTAWGAGNIVADPTRATAAEELRAEGFGTLKALPPDRQGVVAQGVHETSAYRVQFRRALGASKGGVAFAPGERVAVGFAVWNGAAGDRDGKKSVTIWQELLIAR